MENTLVTEEPNNGSPSARLIKLLGDDVVLVAAVPGTKRPRQKGWQKTTVEAMADPAHLALLDESNIAVVMGAASGHLCSIDIDHDAEVGPFLALNPRLADTLRSRGGRGCNFWVRCDGPYPRKRAIKTADGLAWGEWRADGAGTTIYGTHPSGASYVLDPEVPPIHIRFADIRWPEGSTLWNWDGDEPHDGGRDPLADKYGDAVHFREDAEGGKHVTGINEVFWAGLYAAEHEILHEPDERLFYNYDEVTGLYRPQTPDVIRQEIGARLLEFSRTDPWLAPVATRRTDRTLTAIVQHLRGIVERRDAFTDRPRAVHLANAMLRFDGTTCYKEPFSPAFRSRNQSPIAFDPEARCDRFLGELLAPAVKPDDIDLLQKFAGMALLGHNLAQRLLIIDGLAGGGKSTFVAVLRGLVGEANCTQLRTYQLGERFELYRLLGKTLLVGVDVPGDFLQTRGAATLKGLVGGDRFDTEAKRSNSTFSIRGSFNAVVTANARLRVRLEDDVDAWARRLMIVRFEGEPPKRPIPDFDAALLRDEGGGILNWALQGLGLLLRDIEGTGRFKISPRQRAQVDSLLAESDSLARFLADRVERRPDSNLSVAEIVTNYADYCQDNGWTPMPEARITYDLPDLMLAMFRASKSHDCKRDGRSARGFHNVAFKTTPED